MKRYGTPRLRGYVLLAAAGSAAALLTGRPELAVLAAPFVLVLTVGLAMSRPPRYDLHTELSTTRAVQGDEVTLSVSVSSVDGVSQMELVPVLPPGLMTGGRTARVIRVPAGETVEFAITLRAGRWGTFALGGFQAHASDRLGLLRYDAPAGRQVQLKVLPDAGTLQTVVRPENTQIFAGELVSHRRGDGIEFSDVRAFVTGDRPRDVNWRATARLQELHVNQRLAERNADVVVFLDTFQDLRPRPGAPSSLDVAVSAASSVAASYLRRRDRVGLVSWGGYLQWLTPAMGETALYRIVDTLLEARVVRSDAWRGIRILPRTTLPPGALVLALTPLLDARTINALFDLRARGSDVAIVELDPVAFQRPGPSADAQLAHRLWRMSRARSRLRFESRGVVVVPWDGLQRFDEVIRRLEIGRAWCRRRSG